MVGGRWGRGRPSGRPPLNDDGEGRLRAALFAIGTLFCVGLVAWWMRPPDTSAGPCVVITGPVKLPELPESSGLAISRRQPGLLWSHNDSGNAAVLFGIDAIGAVRERVRLPLELRDWEDISAARCASGDCLYIADIGDNQRVRREIRIYRVPEPVAGDTVTGPPEVFTATYADGPHNAEAMFLVNSEMFIVTRDRVGGVYRATANASGNRDLVFERIAQLSLEAVTDAEVSTDGATVVVRTSHEAVLYRTADLTAGQTMPFERIPIDGLREAQGEGVALDGNVLYLSSEGRRAGSLLSLRCDLPGHHANRTS